jgi:tetratricopeptide (TPR) repeat protein
VRPGAGTPRSFEEIRRDLNVATVLDGSVYYAGGRVRVTPRLTDSATGRSLWTNAYEHEQSDILAIQSDIALAVAQALSLELSAAERERVERLPTTNPQARDLYLMARARAPDEALLAIADIEQALKLDPAFKEAWSASSLIRNGAAAIDPGRADQHHQIAEQAARRALELDPEFGDAYRALAYSLLSRNDWVGAETAFRKARSLNVPLAEMGSYAFLQLSAGKFGPLARDIFEQARAADPRAEIFYRFLPFVYEGLGERERASALYDQSMSLFSRDNGEALQRQIQRVHWLVEHDDLVQARTIRLTDPLNAAMLANLEAPEQALAELRRAFEANGRGNPTGYRDIALWAGHFGNPELALASVRAMIDEGGGRMVYVWVPQLAAMRRLPEFKAFVRDIGMVAYWQKYEWPDFCRPLNEHDFECK